MLAFSLIPHWFQLVYIGLCSLCLGSFLNVVIYRLPLQLEFRWRRECTEFLESRKTETETLPAWAMNLWKSRSHCPVCATRIRWYDNIPVLSWFILAGKCRHCQARINLRYPLVESLTTLICILFFLQYGASLKFLCVLPFVLLLITLTFIDLDEQLLPDDLTLPLLWLGLLINVQGVFVPLPAAVYGAAAGYLILWLIYWIFKLLTGKEGMGYGDFKLLAALGAWLGWQCLPIILLLASLTGAVAGIGYLLVRRKNLAFPFGPYLATAGLIALFYHTTLLTWFLGHG